MRFDQFAFKSNRYEFSRNAPKSMYAFTVACVGLHATILERITLRKNDKGAAQSIARQRQPGRLAYSVVEIESE